MTQKNKQMHLGAFPTTYSGHHLGAWRYEGTKTSEITKLNLYQEIAKVSEEGKFDFMFLADVLAHNEEDLEYSPQIRLDAVTLLSALIGSTQKMGLVPTITTSYNEPFNIARKLSTLDHLSDGRSGWNIVTSSHDNEALNFGREKHFEHALRYDKTEEFVDVVKKLWDGWEDGAILNDKESGRFLDSQKVHPINHQGEFYQVRGPLNVPRSPQGHPVLLAAGASERGKDFAARYADVFFTIAPETLAEAQVLYTDMKKRVQKVSRSLEQFKIMPGVVPIVGKTQKEAQEKYEHFQELILPQIGIGMLSRYTGLNLINYSPDDFFPEFPDIENYNGEKGRFLILSERAKKDNLTIRQLGRIFAGGQGHRVLVGTGDYIANEMTEWFEKGACDGFNVKIPYLPGGISDFVEHVTPELQNRGVFRSEYTGNTLRDHLGLPFKKTQELHANEESYS